MSTSIWNKVEKIVNDYIGWLKTDFGHWKWTLDIENRTHWIQLKNSPTTIKKKTNIINPIQGKGNPNYFTHGK